MTHTEDAQKMFDISTVHMIRQGERAVDESGACKYRTANGLKCAVGVLIPDAEYSKWMDRAGSLHEVIRTAHRNNLMTPTIQLMHEHRLLLTSLQEAHDYAALWEDGMVALVHNLRDTAASFNLNCDALDAAVAARSIS